MINGYSYNQPIIPWEQNYPITSYIPPFPPNSKLARAYFIYQRYTRSFSPKEALDKGTMFPELYSPYPYHYGKGI